MREEARGDWDFQISELVKNPDGLCGEYRLSPEGPVSQIDSPQLLTVAPGIFSDFLRSVHMLKREWGAKNNGKLLHLFIPSKTVTLDHHSVFGGRPAFGPFTASAGT